MTESGRDALIEERDIPEGTDTLVGNLPEQYKDAQISQLSEALRKQKDKTRDERHRRKFWAIVATILTFHGLVVGSLLCKGLQEKSRLFKPSTSEAFKKNPLDDKELREACKKLGLDPLTYKKIIGKQGNNGK